MSIEQRDQIDMLGIKDDYLELLVWDHLPWNIEPAHLYMLQAKINGYIHYIMSEMYIERYAEAKRFGIKIAFLQGISRRCLAYLNQVNLQCSTLPKPIQINYFFPEEAETREVVEGTFDDDYFDVWVNLLEEDGYPVEEVLQDIL